MSDDKDQRNTRLDVAITEFEGQCRQTWLRLFAAAKARNELFFAFSLMTEFRGSQGPGWNTAEESKKAFREFMELFPKLEASPVKARVLLSFYSHLSEAAGFYETPKNMLLVAGGESYNLYPFQALVEKHRRTGDAISPNANKIMKDILGHAKSLGMDDLCKIISEAFDPDLRNGYAHADYIVWNNSIRLPRRNGGSPREVTEEEFYLLLNKATVFFGTLWEQVTISITSYSPAARVWGRLNNDDPEEWFKVEHDPNHRNLSISSEE